MFEEKTKTSGHEPFEIFHFGEKIYHKIEGKNPYGLVNNFVTSEKSVKVSKTVEPKLALVINKMIDSSSTKAEVFSELLVEINQF